MTSKLSKLTMTVAVAAITGTGLVSTASAAVDELVVTSQRRAQNLQDVPVAVSAFDEKLMDIRQINETLDLVRMVPNLIGHNNTGPGTANAYFLRGLGSTESIASFDPPVSTYVDDVYTARQNANNYSLFDIERIEVLRGPQGTTFGRNTTGGAINIITRKPGDEFKGRAQLEYGEYDRISISGVVDVPISEKVLTKVAGYYIESDGFVDNTATGEKLNDEEAWGIRGDIRFLINEDITWDLAVENTFHDALSVPTTTTSPRKNASGLRSSCGSPGVLLDALSGCGQGNEAETFAVTSNLKWDISIGTLEFITGWRDLEQDFTIDFLPLGFDTGGFSIVNAGEHTQFTQEIKLNGNINDRLDYVAGLFYMDEENDTDFTDLPFGSLGVSRNLDNTTENISAYVQGDFAINDQWTFTAGVRWTEEEKNIAFTPLLLTGDMLPGTFFGAPFIYTEVTDFSTADMTSPTSQKVSKVTPKVGLQYQMNEDIAFYVSATNGFKSGGWNARGTTGPALSIFGPEEAWSYELGMKGDFLDNTLRLNTAIFFSDITDLQVPSVITGTTTFVTDNVADLENWGVEIEAQYSPNDQLDLFGSIGYMDAEYQNAQVGSQAFGVDVQRTPDWTITAGGNYRIPMNNAAGDVVLGGDVTWVDEQWVSTANTPGSLADSYALVSARAGYETEDGRWAIYAECKNCADEDVYASALFGQAYYGDPRRWNLSARFNF